MLSQIEEALLPIIIAGAIGLLLGAALSTWLRAPRRSDHADAEAAARRRRPALETRVEPAPGAGFETPQASPRWSRDKAPLVADLLLVDDSAVARAKLRKLFDAAGYSVQLARDGVEALALLEAGRYQLMITDLEMPNMDGATLIDNCRLLPQTASMPILTITGHENLRVKFNQCRNISGVHRKPWVDDILLSHVAALVGSTRAQPPGASPRTGLRPSVGAERGAPLIHA
jgi:CheY-like chemotaxis protein